MEVGGIGGERTFRNWVFPVSINSQKYQLKAHKLITRTLGSDEIQDLPILAREIKLDQSSAALLTSHSSGGCDAAFL